MAFNSSFMLVATTAATFCLLNLKLTHCTEFNVGERSGWAVPRPNDTDFYDNWASNKRFKVDDTIRFRYKKDLGDGGEERELQRVQFEPAQLLF
ncbi:hypothetical protein SASPL_149609 [Salvia splendens]|uniref:Phytocyanin domain-containing protein n=1 Tax=Salvia splendens TaxID=180675 RepID=A0A8X8WCI3_SALSN|nr:hypothetical protein SASPL_149609 [Salvia splendens]